MNICWLIPDDRGGGVASVALSCVRQAQASRHEATLLLVLPSTGWLDKEDQKDFFLDSLGLEPPAKDAPAAILQWLKANPQDFLVLNGCEQADVVIPYLPSTVRPVYVVHDTARRYWEPALRHEAVLDAIVAVSQTVAKQFNKRLQNPSKLRVIYNGSRFAPLPKSVTGRASDMLVCCGDNPTKGAYDALRLWRRLAQRGFKGDLHWFGRMEPHFERRVRTLPENNRIHLYGRRSRSEVFAKAMRCRVLLMLSRVEPFGMTTIEAMSMGCVPVAWDIDTGTREIVNHDVNGFFAPLGDTVALSDTVLRAIDAQPKLGPAAMKRARSDFDEKTMWRDYAKLFTELKLRPLSLRPCAGQAPPLRPEKPIFPAFSGILAGCHPSVRGTFAAAGILATGLARLMIESGSNNTATYSPDGPAKTSPNAAPLSFAVLGANTPWVYALAVALAEQGCSTVAISPYDWANYLRLRPRWPAGACPARLQRQWWLMPPGYVGGLTLIFAPILRKRLARCLTRLTTRINALPMRLRGLSLLILGLCQRYGAFPTRASYTLTLMTMSSTGPSAPKRSVGKRRT